MNNTHCQISAVGLISALGEGLAPSRERLSQPDSPVSQSSDYLLGHEPAYVGQVQNLRPLPERWAHLDSRNNQIAYQAYQQIQGPVEQAVQTYGAEKIALVMGTSTGGMSRTEEAFFQYPEEQADPNYRHEVHEVSSVATVLAEITGIKGPSFCVTTACSSSANAIISGARMIEQGWVDAALVGGVDSLCQMTVNGFHALGLISPELSQPLMEARSGLNIGEAGCLLLLERKAGGIQLSGYGQSTDGYHMSAPQPEGTGASQAIEKALAQAGLSPDEITYINLHGTGTELNDQAEAFALARVFPSLPPASSTKPYTGHTLGAAGALECGLCWLFMQQNPEEPKPEQLVLPPHWTTGPYDPKLPALALVSPELSVPTPSALHFLSNSFAFGGNNSTLILSKTTNP